MTTKKQSGRKAVSQRKQVKQIALPDFGPPTEIRFQPLPDVASASKRVKATGVPEAASTGIYIHGIGNHPEEQVLVVRWDRALFGKDMGDRTRMAYWVNRARYPHPSVCDCIDPKCACHGPEEAVRSKPGNGVRSKGHLAIGYISPELELEQAVQSLTSDPAERDFLRSLGQQMIDRARVENAKQKAGFPLGQKGIYAVHGKGIGDAILRKLTDIITGMALPDVQDFLFEPNHRQQMEDIFLARLQSGGNPFVVIAHSQGSMIAYDVLRRLKKSDIDVKLFVTIGSPLGLPPVRSVFKQWTKSKKLPFPRCVSRWINIAAAGDVVAFDPTLANDIAADSKGEFKEHFIDRTERDANLLFAGNPHSSMGYLTTKFVQENVYKAVGREFVSSLSKQIITSDLVELVETQPDGFRHKVMIEVQEQKAQGPSSISEGRQRIDNRLRQLAAGSETDADDLKILHHTRFISAELTRREIETLRTEFFGLQVNRIWQNSLKRALICRSAHMVQATPAHQAYGAHGHEIEWAVLDTGINHHHPHFGMHANIASLWDCTRSHRKSEDGINEPRGDFVKQENGKLIWPKDADNFIDKAGHGTHVSGIIAGQFPHPLDDGNEKLVFAGMAPKAKLHSFKVLDDRGQGEDAWILIALDKIARINEQAQSLRIHGINLSLGGNFDPSVYGCGHTPLCTELRRLWRQGVLIVLAAGNEGFAVLQTLEDGPWQVNLDLSIGDPANLDEAIAVGSVHKVNPHTFGVSFFSSRGPTADGRPKPDLVAPGEKILSARADFADLLGGNRKSSALTEKQLVGLSVEQLYVAESGTSMAAPHVSGLLAAFLSQRREFIGYPDRVKKIMLDNCTDLGRDTYAQGAGLPNLIKMLAGT